MLSEIKNCDVTGFISPKYEIQIGVRQKNKTLFAALANKVLNAVVDGYKALEELQKHVLYTG